MSDLSNSRYPQKPQISIFVYDNTKEQTPVQRINPVGVSYISRTARFWAYPGNYLQRMDLRKLHIIKDQVTHGFDTCFKGTVVHEKLRRMMVSYGFQISSYGC